MPGSVQSLYDDGSSNLSIGGIKSTLEKYRESLEIDSEFFGEWHALGMPIIKLSQLK